MEQSSIFWKNKLNLLTLINKRYHHTISQFTYLAKNKYFAYFVSYLISHDSNTVAKIIYICLIKNPVQLFLLYYMTSECKHQTYD